MLPVSEIKSSSCSKFENESDITDVWGFAGQITSYFPWETSCLMTALVSSSLKRYDFPYPLKTLAWEANKLKGTVRKSSYSRGCVMDVSKQGVGFCTRDQNEPIRRLVHESHVNPSSHIILYWNLLLLKPIILCYYDIMRKYYYHCVYSQMKSGSFKLSSCVMPVNFKISINNNYVIVLSYIYIIMLC